MIVRKIKEVNNFNYTSSKNKSPQTSWWINEEITCGKKTEWTYQVPSPSDYIEISKLIKKTGIIHVDNLVSIICLREYNIGSSSVNIPSKIKHEKVILDLPDNIYITDNWWVKRDGDDRYIDACNNDIIRIYMMNYERKYKFPDNILRNSKEVLYA